MKRLNKVLALVLAMTMMFGVLSVFASAADTVNAAFKVEFVDNDGNAITEVKAGSTANVIVSIKTNGYSPIFAFLAFYDYTALTHIRQNGSAAQSITGNNCRELYGRFANTGHYEEDDALLEYENSEIGNGYVNDWGFTGNITVTPHKDLMWEGIGFTDAQKAQYKGINFGYLVPGTDSNSTVNTNGEFVKMVRFRFLAEKDTILNQNTFFLLDNDTKTYITIDPDGQVLRNLQTSTPVKCTNLTVEYPTAGGNEGGGDSGDTPTVTAPVSSKEVQVKWKDKANKEIYIGFCGEYTGTVTTTKDPVTGKDIVNEITEIGFLFSTSDNTFAEGTYTQRAAETLYDFGSGTYKFRVVAEATTDSELPLYGKAYIKLAGSDTILLANDKIETTVAAEYEQATKMEGFNA